MQVDLTEVIIVLLGVVGTIVLGVISFFLRQIHTDFVGTKKDIIEIKMKVNSSSDEAHRINERLRVLERKADESSDKHTKLLETYASAWEYSKKQMNL